MRIQHNILAMNAYRNYNNNTSALGKNLERLSSGYKINRAGDDAAGLAISEKMRAQITGLDAAKKNVKDGISLVKTAEGAMQEVQDMLNRMAYLATQSANGTYDAEVDRANLQKEVDALKTEINRIADSANFNGIKLLDGTVNGVTAQSAYTEVLSERTVNGIDRILSADIQEGQQPWQVNQTANVYDAYSAKATKAEFKVDLNRLNTTFQANASSIIKAMGTAGAATLTAASLGITGKTLLTLTIGGKDIAVNASLVASAIKIKISASGAVSASIDTQKLATAVMRSIVVNIMNKSAASAAKATSAVISGLGGMDDVTWRVKASGGKLTFTQVANPTKKEECSANFGVQLTFGENGVVEVSGTKANGKLFLTGNLLDGTEVVKTGAVDGGTRGAATVFSMTAADIRDGTIITIGDMKIELAVGANSKVTNKTWDDKHAYVDLTDMDPSKIDLHKALTKISEAVTKAATNNNGYVNVSGKNGKGETVDAVFKVGVARDGQGIAVERVVATSVLKNIGKDSMGISSSTDVAFDTRTKLADIFSIKQEAGSIYHQAVDASGGLVLQIGDTSENFNQMRVIVGDMHTTAMGIGDVNISTQQGAQDAVQTIRDAINYVSGVRGDLGAVQNRLEHTQNNLSVMAENIQDAESTIRDTDVAEEMMSYVKNNILVQSAQAMLAQANQVPQGVLQLLG